MTLYTLSGWAQPHDALESLLPEAQHVDYHSATSVDEVAQLLAATVVDGATVVGWSMGGSLLMYAIAFGYICPSQLVLVAAPAQFVACETFPHGMDPITFALFRDGYVQNPSRTAKRFSGLIAKGDRDATRISKSLPAWESSADADYWHPWLHALGDGRHDQLEFSDFPPTLLIHGKQDAIVDHAQSEWLAEQLPNATLLSLDEAGHAPHLHDEKTVRDAILAVHLQKKHA